MTWLSILRLVDDDKDYHIILWLSDISHVSYHNSFIMFTTLGLRCGYTALIMQARDFPLKQDRMVQHCSCHKKILKQSNTSWSGTLYNDYIHNTSLFHVHINIHMHTTPPMYRLPKNIRNPLLQCLPQRSPFKIMLFQYARYTVVWCTASHCKGADCVFRACTHQYSFGHMHTHRK